MSFQIRKRKYLFKTEFSKMSICSSANSRINATLRQTFQISGAFNRQSVGYWRECLWRHPDRMWVRYKPGYTRKSKNYSKMSPPLFIYLYIFLVSNFSGRDPRSIVYITDSEADFRIGECAVVSCFDSGGADRYFTHPDMFVCSRSNFCSEFFVFI